jgi:hypothetical protein
MRIRSVSFVAVATAALVGSGAVVALAVTTPIDGNGRIHACFATKSGALRAISPSATCSSTEQSLIWNQTGPQGPAGQPGPQGPAGPSAVTLYNRDAQMNVAQSNGPNMGANEIILVEPGAGTYALHATVWLANFSDATPVRVWCGIQGFNNTVPFHEVLTELQPGENDVVPLEAIGNFPRATDAVNLECYNDDQYYGGNPVVQHAQLMVQQAGTANEVQYTS